MNDLPSPKEQTGNRESLRQKRLLLDATLESLCLMKGKGTDGDIHLARYG